MYVFVRDYKKHKRLHFIPSESHATRENSFSLITRFY